MIECEGPQRIVRDGIDGSRINESDLGYLSSPEGSSMMVQVVHPKGFEATCQSRLLAIHSMFFRRHLGRFPPPTSVTVTEKIPIDGLVSAIAYVESGETEVDPRSLYPLLTAASRLEMPRLQRSLEQYLRSLSMSSWSCFLMCLDVCYRSPASVQLRVEMLRQAAESFENLYGLAEWPEINDRLVRQLFLRRDLNASSPIAVLEAALSWIAGNPNAEPAAAERVITAVPFHRVSTLDRLQGLEKAERMGVRSLVQPRVALAEWSYRMGKRSESDRWVNGRGTSDVQGQESNDESEL